MDKCIDRVLNVLMVTATFLVAAIALFKDWILHRFWPPKLDITPYSLTGILVDTVALQTSQKGRGRWYSLAVVNRRRWRTPRKCQVLLVGVSRRNPVNGRFDKQDLACPLPLYWSPAKQASDLQTILRPTVFDFVYLLEGDQAVRPGVRYQSFDFEGKGFVGPNQACRYELEVVAEAFISQTTCIYEVAWDGEWHDSDSEMSKHLKITRCSSLT
jgi:hypothetical protein